MKKTIFIAAGLAALLSAPAFGASSCLRINQIYDWQAKDNQTMIVEDTFHRKFEVDIVGSCIDLKNRQTVGFNARGGTGQSCLSGGDTVFFREPDASQQKCSVKSVVAYTPQMEKADEAKKKTMNKIDTSRDTAANTAVKPAAKASGKPQVLPH